MVDKGQAGGQGRGETILHGLSQCSRWDAFCSSAYFSGAFASGDDDLVSFVVEVMSTARLLG